MSEKIETRSQKEKRKAKKGEKSVDRMDIRCFDREGQRENGAFQLDEF
jgi:hypothetical protein